MSSAFGDIIEMKDIARYRSIDTPGSFRKFKAIFLALRNQCPKCGHAKMSYAEVADYLNRTLDIGVSSKTVGRYCREGR